MIRNEDNVGLEINAKLRSSFDLLAVSEGEYSNVIGIFYHELMLLLTNYHLLKCSSDNYLQPMHFPFLNTSYLKQPSQLTFEHQQDDSLNKRELLLKLACATTSPLKPYLAICKEAYLNSYVAKLIYYLALHGRRSQFETNTICYIPNQYEQLDFLYETIKDILSSLGMNDSEPLALSFINYVRIHLTDEPVEKTKGDYLLCGSMSCLVARINACNYKMQGKIVIALSHDKSSFTKYNEPVVGYGELSYCDYYLDVGNAHNIKKLQHVVPLQKMPIIRYFSNKLIREKFNKKAIIKYKAINKSLKICYLPTGFSGANRYGPFRDYDDSVYIRWQKNLMDHGLNITYKSHPTLKNSPDWIKQYPVDNRPLEKCMDDYDLFIIDFFGTAQAYAAATDKPIIFFDIGLRNMNVEYRKALENRCFFHSIDIFKELVSQIKTGLTNYNNSNKNFINTYTEQFCLNRDPNINRFTLIRDILMNTKYNKEQI